MRKTFGARPKRFDAGLAREWERRFWRPRPSLGPGNDQEGRGGEIRTLGRTHEETPQWDLLSCCTLLHSFSRNSKMSPIRLGDVKFSQPNQLGFAGKKIIDCRNCDVS